MAAYSTAPISDGVEWHLTSHPRSVGRSRKLLRGQAKVWNLSDDATETAALLLSELMTNACCHARVPADRYIAARCLLRDGTVRVEVSDSDAQLPHPRHASTGDECGRGLALVAALADAWGAHPRPGGIGKTVWFELGRL
ncbi:anti-sigma regulatory factor (Ser/Thr protein kinase) [Kitasatospora sp. MAA4]|uniref:ATP-binding protein n=1 Tax=Kitasatospora sp. MAA4 TaxID=3035093 RepID=UPI00247345EA|nr:ATP-binding protein [Kitasatospora sp. MAA4]MDH6135430.1 anti-sigma regulatory factor (Ser/Thr protein kinase) [Kitasatospora sp. MAA4]